jgi:hypothetical protein
VDRLVVGADAQITSDPFVDIDGETPAALGGVPVVAVTNAAGTVLAAPVAVADASRPGRYLATLTAAVHLAQPDELTVVWTSGTHTKTQKVAVASGRYATVADCREVRALANAGEYPAWRIIKAITEFEDVADDYRGVAFVRRVDRWTIRLDAGRSILFFPRVEIREVRAVTGPAGALPVASWYWDGSDFVKIDSAAAGVVTTPTGSGYDVDVTVEHGYTQAVPEPLRRACVEYVRSVLLRESTNLPRDIIAQAQDGFVTRFSTPDAEKGRPTGFLEVDRLLNQLTDRRPPGIA